MNGYVLCGYVVVLGSTGGYALSLVTRLRGARRRVEMNARHAASRVAGDG